MMVAEVVPLPLPGHYTADRSGSGKSTMSTPTLSFHPFVRSAPSFRPDLHTARAVAHSGGQGWPVFGPPRQRRAASLTVASTAARLVASGCLAGTHQTWRKKRAHVQLKKLAHAHNAPVPPTEMADLRFPASQIRCELVHKDDRRSLARFFVVQPNSIRICVRHLFSRVFNAAPPRARTRRYQ